MTSKKGTHKRSSVSEDGVCEKRRKTTHTSKQQAGNRRVPLGALTNRVNANNTRHGKDKDNVDKKADSVPTAFTLKSAGLSKIAKQKRATSVSSEHAKEQSQREFRARDMPDWARATFSLKRAPTEALTSFDVFHHYSDERHVDRQIFEIGKQERISEKVARKRERTRINDEAEREAVQEMRKTLVHNAKPLPRTHHTPFIPKSSSKPLTLPATPEVLRRSRRLAKA